MMQNMTEKACNPAIPGAHFYRLFTRQLFSGLDALLRDAIFTPEKLIQLTGDVYPLGHEKALSQIKKHIQTLGSGHTEKKPRLALTPAGLLFRELAAEPDFFTGVELVGCFDNSVTEPRVQAGINIYPTSMLQSFEIDHILLIHGPLAHDIFNQLATLVDFGKTEFYCPYWDPISADGQQQDTITAIKTLCENRREGPVIIVTCIQFFSFLFKRLQAMRKANARVILITLLDTVSNAMPVANMQEACDYIFSAQGNMLDYLRVLSAVKPDALHIFANAGSSAIPLIVATVSQAPYWVEYNDILTTMFSRDTLAAAMGAEDAAMELNCEKELIRNARGLIHKYNPTAIDNLFRFHGITVPALQFFPYPATPRSRPSLAATSRQQIRIVFIGGILPEQNDSHQSTWQMYGIIEIITSQGIVLDFYNAYDSGTTTDFASLHQRAKENPLFSYFPSLHPAELRSTLETYDLGWMVHNVAEIKTSVEVAQTCTSSRFFEYLEAGLPVIINQDYRYMADIIEENNLGIVIQYNQVQSIGQIIADHDLNALKKNVACFANSIRMDANIGRLLELYRQGAANA